MANPSPFPPSANGKASSGTGNKNLSRVQISALQNFGEFLPNFCQYFADSPKFCQSFVESLAKFQQNFGKTSCEVSPKFCQNFAKNSTKFWQIFVKNLYKVSSNFQLNFGKFLPKFRKLPEILTKFRKKFVKISLKFRAKFH